MPVTKSAKKAHRQSLTKRSRNRHFSALYKEVLKKFQKAVASNASEAVGLLSEVYSAIDTLVKKNILHKNTAARKKSAVSKVLAKMGTVVAVEKKPSVKKAVKAAAAKTAKAEKAEAAPAKEAAPKKPAAKKETAAKAPAKKAK